MLEETQELIIRGNCPDYVCGACRTKYGWPHQVWCSQKDLTEPTCEDCTYYNQKKARCVHPMKRGVTNEKSQAAI